MENPCSNQLSLIHFSGHVLQWRLQMGDQTNKTVCRVLIMSNMKFPCFARAEPLAKDECSAEAFPATK
jgi:hypothetical protein